MGVVEVVYDDNGSDKKGRFGRWTYVGNVLPLVSSLLRVSWLLSEPEKDKSLRESKSSKNSC